MDIKGSMEEKDREMMLFLEEKDGNGIVPTMVN